MNTYLHIDMFLNNQIFIFTYTHMYICSCIHIYIHIHLYIEKIHTDRQTDGQTDRQTYIDTEMLNANTQIEHIYIYTFSHFHINMYM